MVAGILLLSSFPCEESPRYLYKIGDEQKANQSLAMLWGLLPEDPLVCSEMESIQRQLSTEQEQTGRSWISALKELFLVVSNQKRLLFVLSEQILSQWSGANSITSMFCLLPIDIYTDKKTAYAPELFALFGLTGQSEKLFTTAILGAVKLVSSLICAVFLIDHIGRKRSLISGILIQQASMLYIAIYLTVEPSTSDNQPPSAKRAAIAAIVFIYLVGVGWAMGWNSIQYLINAEVFPLRVRAIGSSLLMCFHYANRYGLSKVCLHTHPPKLNADQRANRPYHLCFLGMLSSQKEHSGSSLL